MLLFSRDHYFKPMCVCVFKDPTTVNKIKISVVY